MNPYIFRLSAALACLSLPTPLLAQAAAPCLTPAEAKGLIQAALPEAVNGAITKCKTSLPASAFLVRSGPELVARYKDSAKAGWPSAKAAFLKLAGENAQMLAALPDETAMSLISVGINAALADNIKPEQCAYIDRGIGALAPLPLENVADLTTMILELGSANAGKPGKSPLKICPAPEGKPAPTNSPSYTTGTK